MEKDADDPNLRPQTDDAAIRRRAYELYEARGYADGDDMADWLAAEREIADRASALPDDLGEPPRDEEEEDR